MLHDPERRWIYGAACGGQDPESFFINPHNPKTVPGPDLQAELDKRKQICLFHCPVLAECRRDTMGEEFGIWGGMDEHERYLLRRRRNRNPRALFTDEEWSNLGNHIDDLLKRRFNYSQIGRSIGLGWEAMLTCHNEWQEKQAQLKAEAEQAAREAAELIGAARAVTPFPKGAGKYDGWVRKDGRIGDAVYQAQTTDGQFLLMRVRTPSGSWTFNWLPAGDVQLYRDCPPVHAEYLGRQSNGETKRRRRPRRSKGQGGGAGEVA